MSRWDNLKSDYPKSKPSSQQINARRPHHGRIQRPSNNRSRAAWERHSNASRSTNEVSLESLKQQLQLYKTGNSDFDASKVKKNLESISTSKTRAVGEASSGEEYVDFLITLLEIEDASIHQAVASYVNTLVGEKNASMSKSSAINYAMFLAEQCHASATCSSICINSLTQLIQIKTDILPAEETAQDIVARVFLPSLESASTDDQVKVTICRALSSLFQDPRHTSALLSPLIQDVTSDGKEEAAANPLRKRILATLEVHLYSTSESDSLKATFCHILAGLINALEKIENQNAPPPSAVDVHLPSMECFLLDILETSNQALFAPSLVLLRALIKRCPKAMTKVGSRLIMKPSRKQVGKEVRCSNCLQRTNELGHLLAAAHTSLSKSELEVTNLATDCLADLVAALPWNRWLVVLSTSPQRGVSGLYRQVTSSLETITRITLCSFQRCDERSVESVMRLIDKLFTSVPWSEEKLARRASDLWSTMARYLLLATNPTKVRAATAEVLISSMGGRVTPQGELLPMCIPARTWFARDASVPFLALLFDTLASEKSLSRQSVELLSAILRTRPETAYSLWVRFRDLLIKLSSSETGDKKLVSISLLEAFMLGRRDFGVSTDDKWRTESAVELTVLVLENTRDYSNVQCRCSSLNIYGAMHTEDWILIDQEKERLVTHFESMLSYCLEPNGKVRAAACKATGDFCSNYITEELFLECVDLVATTSQTSQIARQVSDAMLEVLDDKNASVRSMALFSLGNLAHALREANRSDLLGLHTILRVNKKAQLALEDSNDKVAGNAIRSIGHWGFLLGYSIAQSACEDAKEMLRLVLNSLTVKVTRTLALSSAEGNVKLSWKQRSAVKKHGWGACNSLGQLFTAVNDMEDEELISYCREPVRQLASCIKHFAELNEKVAVSAMTALRGLDPTKLAEVTAKTGLIGEVLAKFIVRLYEVEAQSNPASLKIANESQLLVRHLLASASILDAHVVLKHEDVSKTTMGFLYTWMVENDMEGRAFENFALALQRPGLVSPDVSLEQNFASRAIQQYKKDHYLTLGSDEPDNDDDADEL